MDTVTLFNSELCYNKQTRNAEWVFEHLQGNKGKPDRTKSKFKEDPDIPALFRSHLQDYQGSGYDRGHLVPAADINASQKALNETFFLSNTSPQSPAFNRGYWALFEKFVRNLQNHFDDVYVVTGPLFLPFKQGENYYVKYQVLGR
jgi:endonuclease G